MTGSRPVAVGDTLGPVVHRPDALMLFQYSAVLWNPHRIHYDRDYARDVAGHPDLVVPGPLQGRFLEELLAGWAGADRLASLRYRHHASAYVDGELTASGAVVEIGADGTIRCELRVLDARGTVTTSGEGTIRPRPEESTR